MAERPPSRAVRDAAGAILVVGVFLAVFLVGMLFYVVGIGEAVLRRERLGDAADAVSMASAVVHARSMNLIVLLNQVMAALLAVLVALRLVEMLATLAIVVLVSTAYFTGGAGLAAIPGLQEVRSGARTAYETLDQPIHACLKALNGVARAVSAATPALAELEALAVVGKMDPKAGATLGVVVLPRLTLPVENDRFRVLCEHAGKDAAEAAMLPLSPILPGAVSDEVEDALGDLAGSASDWFCGKGSGKPPAIHRTVTRVLPTLGARERCEASTKRSHASGSADCAAVEQREASSEPDASGACRVGCGGGGAYQERIEKAREQCNPGRRAGLRGFSWQEREAHIEIANRGSGWEPTGRRWNDPPRRISKDDSSGEHPCGTPQATYAKDFAESPREPVCSTPLLLPVRAGTGIAVVDVTEVLQIFRCVLSEQHEIGGNFDDSRRAGDGSEEAPQRLISEAPLGGEVFQERGVVTAGEPPAYAERIVETAAWGAKVKDPTIGIAGLGDRSFAQAEYFFDHDGGTPREEWMWSRRWTARLRRLQWPAKTSGGSSGDGNWFEWAGASLGTLSSH